MADIGVRCRLCGSVAMYRHQTRGASVTYACCDCGRYTSVGPGRFWRYGSEVRERARQLREDGWSWRRISAELGVPHMTVKGWIR